MGDILEQKVKAVKAKINNCKADLERLQKENAAGNLSPLEKMQISSLIQEQKELNVKLRELLM